MQEQLLNSNNLKEKLKELGVLKKAPSNVQEWLNTVAHKHWLKLLPQERFTGSINEDWFQQKSQNTIFKQLVITPQFTAEVSHLVDFLNQNYLIKKDDEIIYKPLNKLNYLECQRQAQKWIDRINNKTSLEEDWDGLKEVKRIEFEGQEYTLYELTSRQNLLREGKVMNNCISTYASQTAEENKNTKFYSLRDKDNKSLVSMSAYFTNFPITDLEREEWIIERSTNAYKDSTYIANETKEAKDKKRDEKSSQATHDYNAYLQEMQDKRGNLYAISEIKEKNNEPLDFYGPLVKKLINNLFEKTGTLSDINKYVLNEIDFIKLTYRNKIIIESEPKVIPRYEVGYFEDLNNDNYNYIEHLPDNAMKKLKATILSEPNSVPLDLMNKTNWRNIKNQKIDNLHIKATDKLVLVEDSNLRVSYTGGSHIDSFSFFNKCENLRVKINEVNNLVIKESEGIKIEFLGNKLNSTHVSPNYITMINCSVKEAKPSVPAVGKDYSHYNILLIDKKELTELPHRVNPFEDELTNIIYIDTVKEEIIKNTNISELDFYPYIKARYHKEGISLPLNNLEEYVKERINFLNINLVSGLDSLEVIAHDLYNLKINIPCKDKSLLLKAIERPNEFKDIIFHNLLKANQSLYEEDFQNYMEVKISKSFNELIQVEGKKQILEVNEKFKEDPNEINYAEIVLPHLNEMKEPDINLITHTQMEKLKIIKDVYLENLDASRVNNSRTKLTKNFSESLVYRLEDILFKGQKLTDEAREFLETTLSSPAKVEKPNKPKI